MKSSSSQQPFLFIVFFSLMLMLVLLFMQYKSSESIHNLQKGSEKAVRTFQVNNKMQEIINYNYEIESTVRKFLISKKSDTAVYIPQSIISLEVELKKLKLLASNGSNQPLVTNLTDLIQQEVTLYQNVLDASYKDNDSATTAFI
jgi:CHASE3 domain sensor protein